MTRDDHGGYSSLSDSATGPASNDPGNVGSKTARPDNLAAIMRDSTIILDAQAYAVGDVYVQPPIHQGLPTTPPADRGDPAQMRPERSSK